MKPLYPTGLLSEHPPLRSEAEVMADRERRRQLLEDIVRLNMQETTIPQRKRKRPRLRAWATPLGVLAIAAAFYGLLYLLVAP